MIINWLFYLIKWRKLKNRHFLRIFKFSMVYERVQRVVGYRALHRMCRSVCQLGGFIIRLKFELEKTHPSIEERIIWGHHRGQLPTLSTVDHHATQWLIWLILYHSYQLNIKCLRVSSTTFTIKTGISSSDHI